MRGLPGEKCLIQCVCDGDGDGGGGCWVNMVKLLNYHTFPCKRMHENLHVAAFCSNPCS